MKKEHIKGKILSKIFSFTCLLLFLGFIYFSLHKGYTSKKPYSKEFIDSVIFQNKFLQTKLDSIEKDSIYKDYLSPKNRAVFKFWYTNNYNK